VRVGPFRFAACRRQTRVLSLSSGSYREDATPPAAGGKNPTLPANWLIFPAPKSFLIFKTFEFVLGTAVAQGAATLLNDWRPIKLIRKHVAIALSVLITALSLALPSTVSAQTDAENEKVRAKVQVLSASRDQQVEVKFRDKTKVKGYITAVEPVSFTLRDPKSGTTESIAYSEVDSVSKASGGVSTKTWLILGGVAAGVATTWLIVKPAVCDGGAQTRGVC
jgi:hypothetical protein